MESNIQAGQTPRTVRRTVWKDPIPRRGLSKHAAASRPRHTHTGAEKPVPRLFRATLASDKDTYTAPAAAAMWARRLLRGAPRGDQIAAKGGEQKCHGAFDSDCVVHTPASCKTFANSFCRFNLLKMNNEHGGPGQGTLSPSLAKVSAIIIITVCTQSGRVLIYKSFAIL
ncbi:unnamed protein product [Pleuronectes platessa]|uniref:Uncharacterized protein n=1 Tax=Pleuronectes platessa TaxID=8262 RepID=A0A9N7YSU0_PLEPL|nr:unnamed protein product [Pleuronectes platessa]